MMDQFMTQSFGPKPAEEATPVVDGFIMQVHAWGL